MTVDTATSDLWFNHDHDEYRPNYTRDGDDADWDVEAMKANAENFAYCISQIGGQEYTPQELVDDFFNRL